VPNLPTVMFFNAVSERAVILGDRGILRPITLAWRVFTTCAGTHFWRSGSQKALAAPWPYIRLRVRPGRAGCECMYGWAGPGCDQPNCGTGQCGTSGWVEGSGVRGWESGV